MAKKIKFYFFLHAFIFLKISPFLSQNNYFQQKVNYKIDVSLNDSTHSLSGFEEITYINNSSKKIDTIYFHLWPNAYKNNNTALCKQLLQQNKTVLFYAKPEERGFIDSLNFKVNNQIIKWEIDKTNIDICKLILNKPLLSFDSIIITTPFFVKIPDSKFSRLGHNQQAYFITQWYPKPAVYDLQGWHCMPYLDQGEFYSEFGNFNVAISLPKNYLLAATGDRINADDEEDFLNEKIKETKKIIKNNIKNTEDDTIPKSSNEFKTIRFVQEKVHDFAWFANKQFYVLKDEIELEKTKRKVKTWVFFTKKNINKWKKAINYVNESTLFYSKLISEYPYNHVTAVDGTIMAGGGMEYPNITVIGDVESDLSLDIVISHEVGHNWFYGILGNNERDQPALDEGINSFYEMRYLKNKYPNKKLTELIGKDSTFKLLGLNKTPYWKEKEFLYFISQKSRTDQKINLSSNKFTSFNYGSIIYSKTPVILDYLMDYLGEDVFDKAIKEYYNENKFKHPSINNLFEVLTKSSQKKLIDFENYFFNSTQNIDYKIKKIYKNNDSSYTIKIKNKTGVKSPFNIYSFKNNVPTSIIWDDGFKKIKTFTFDTKNSDFFKIDGLDRMPDINRKNNIIKANGILKKIKPLQLNFITKLEDPTKNQINYLPITGYNFYNNFMIGMAFYNYGFYQNKIEYLIAPLFGFKSLSPAGFAEFNIKIYPSKIFQQISIGSKIKKFDYNTYENKFHENKNLNYIKISPFITFEIKKKEQTSKISQIISYVNSNFFTDSIDTKIYQTFAIDGPRIKNTYSFLNQLNYSLTNKQIINSFKFDFNFQHTYTLAKISTCLNYKLSLSPKKYLYLRFFAGFFINGSDEERSYYAFRASGFSGTDDYTFENNFIARNEVKGLGASQFNEVDGAIKKITSFGKASQSLLALNITSPNLIKFPIKIFADFALIDANRLNKNFYLWDAGINITLVKNIIDVYIPIIYNNEFNNVIINNTNFFNFIRFTLNIHKLVPQDFIKNNFL